MGGGAKVMNILHIASHMGDGAGKAIGGITISGMESGHTHKVLLLDIPQKTNHIDRCRKAGVMFIPFAEAEEAIAWADIVILNWWAGGIMDKFLSNFPDVPCRIILWSHKNGYYDPPLPQKLVDACDYLLATSPLTLENPSWAAKGSLVYGFGDFDPAAVSAKKDYSLSEGIFTIGYVGSPSYKKLPQDYLDFCRSVIRQIPNSRFVLLGETSDEIKRDVEQQELGQYFDFIGWVQDINDYLLSFDVFGYLLNPRTYATTENALLEAMAAGIPAVVSRQPIGKYLLDEGISGFLVDSPEEYGQVIMELYSDGALRKRIGEAGRNYTINHCKKEVNLKSFNEACKTVLALPKRRQISIT